MHTRKLHLTLTVQSEQPITDADLAMIGHNAIAEVDHLAEATYAVVPLHADGLPIDAVRRALSDYEHEVDAINALDLRPAELHFADVVRLLLQQIDALDPVALSQTVLDSHAIRPDWKRSGEQILHLIAEGIVAAVGTPVESQTTPGPGLHLIADDTEFLDAVLAVLPSEAAENPMPFVEISQRLRNYTAHEVRGALVALDTSGRVRLQYGRGYSKVEAD